MARWQMRRPNWRLPTVLLVSYSAMWILDSFLLMTFHGMVKDGSLEQSYEQWHQQNQFQVSPIPYHKIVSLPFPPMRIDSPVDGHRTPKKQSNITMSRRKGTSLHDFHHHHRQNDDCCRDYLLGFNARNSFDRRNLLFLHIPKTAGTTMELAVAAQQGNLSWGRCWMMRPQLAAPQQIRRATEDSNRLDCPSFSGSQAPFPMVRNMHFVGTSIWHTPIHFFPLILDNADRKGSHSDGQGAVAVVPNPYDHHDTFTIVRNPMERLQSEYFYICRERPSYCQSLSLNEYLDVRLSDASSFYWLDAGHYIPQYDFVVGPHDVRYCDHILHLEHNMSSMFDRLAAAYRLPLHWPSRETANLNAKTYQQEIQSASNKGSAALSIEMKQLIRKQYAMDWKLLV